MNKSLEGTRWKRTAKPMPDPKPVLAAPGTPLWVTNTNDAGPGSLREALQAVSHTNTILFTAPFRGVIKLKSDLPTLAADQIDIDGTSCGIVIDGSEIENSIFLVRGDRIVINGLIFKEVTLGMFGSSNVVSDCTFLRIPKVRPSRYGECLR